MQDYIQNFAAYVEASQQIKTKINFFLALADSLRTAGICFRASAVTGSC